MFEDGAPYCGLSSVDLMVEWPNFWRRHQGGASRREPSQSCVGAASQPAWGVHCTEETIRGICQLDMIQLEVIDRQ